MKKLLMSLVLGLVVNSAALTAAEVPCLKNGVAAISVSITGSQLHNPTIVEYGKSTVLAPGQYRLTYAAMNGRDIRPLFLDRKTVFTNYGFAGTEPKYTLEYPAN